MSEEVRQLAPCAEVVRRVGAHAVVRSHWIAAADVHRMLTDVARSLV